MDIKRNFDSFFACFPCRAYSILVVLINPCRALKIDILVGLVGVAMKLDPYEEPFSLSPKVIYWRGFLLKYSVCSAFRLFTAVFFGLLGLHTSLHLKKIAVVKILKVIYLTRNTCYALLFYTTNRWELKQSK